MLIFSRCTIVGKLRAHSKSERVYSNQRSLCRRYPLELLPPHMSPNSIYISISHTSNAVAKREVILIYKPSYAADTVHQTFSNSTSTIQFVFAAKRVRNLGPGTRVYFRLKYLSGFFSQPILREPRD